MLALIFHCTLVGSSHRPVSIFSSWWILCCVPRLIIMGMVDFMWCCLPARAQHSINHGCISSDVGRTLLSVKKCHITDNLTETTHTHAINQYHIIIHNYHPTLYLNNKSILLFFDHFWHCHDGTTIYDSYGIRINSSRRAIATVPSALHSVILFIIYAFGMPKRIILDSIRRQEYIGSNPLLPLLYVHQMAYVWNRPRLCPNITVFWSHL